MNNTEVTLTAEPPRYAPDGSRGYFLSVTGGRRITGWIRVGDDSRTVYATLDRAPWQAVATVADPAELTSAWIAEHADAIVRPF
ncbi:hypothetical protein [Amycolatopsis sp. NPDC004378]